MILPTIAIIGRPKVGTSTLVNLLCQSNDEIVFDNIDDLQKIFELYSNKDLSWFFSAYINLIEPLDYKISLKEKKILISEKSKNEINIPIPIRKEFNNNITKDIIHLKETNESELNYQNNINRD